MSSTGTHRVRNRAYAPLALAKGAVEAAVRFLAVELAPREITVNAVAPGPTDTEAFEAMGDEGLRERLVGRDADGPHGRARRRGAADRVAVLAGGRLGDRPADLLGRRLPAGLNSARQSFSGVNGGSTQRPPSAAVTALAIAAGVPIVPASPIPLAPSGFSGDGDSTNAVSIGGCSPALSIA